MRKFIQPKIAQGAVSEKITIEKQSRIIVQVRHYRNESFILKPSTVFGHNYVRDGLP